MIHTGTEQGRRSGDVREAIERVRSGEPTLAEAMESPSVRQEVVRQVIEHDVGEHRDIYDRLAEK
ncbi:hypothetical protein BRC90_05725 [Halobacteriales archaeon QS_4_69_34]|nr:MAG: hypothetical protein BRC90_05725 [Halobacteriales archaeon QS_4_69_34]